MKIVCDSCATKYQIADEKVSGKAFKIRCKKCGHVIVVNKGAGDGAGGQAADAGGAAEPAPAPEAAAPTDAVWHLVIDREQVGPMTVDEVRTKVQAGQVDSETYGWKEGFDDWLKLSAIEDFKGLFTAAPPPSDQATKQISAATGASAAAATAILSQGSAPSAAETYTGGTAGGEPARTAGPGAATIVAGDGFPQRAPAVEAGGGGIDAPVKSMTGARSENSVLFSLNNLSALAGSDGGGGGSAPSAGGASAGKPGYATAQSEASGLIDIRAMAAATLGVNAAAGPSSANKAPDLFGGADPAPVFTPIAPAVLMPSAEPAGVPKWVFALVGVGGLMFVGMIVVLVMFLGDNKPTPTQPATGTTTTPEKGTTATGPTPSTPTTPSATGPTPSTKPSTPEAATKPSTPSEPAAGKEGSSKSGKSKSEKTEKSGSSKPSTKETKPEKEPEAPAPKPVEAPPKPKAPAKPKDDLDSLLDSASSGSGGKPAKQEARADLPDQLSQSQIKSALNKASTGECKAGGASGVYMIKITIGKNGSVSSASLSSGGGNGDCVVSAVKKVKFDQFSGDPMSITYPVLVR